jgi:RND superfamily putative drug exporter
MTRQLARLADIAYRRRGRVVVAWIAATVVIIGVGSALAGEYNADYNTPGSESKAASDLTEERFSGYSGQEIYVVWKDPAGAQSAGAKQRIDAFLAEAKKVDHIAQETPIRVSENGKIGATGSRSSSAVIRSTRRRRPPARRGSASSARRSCC